jgi:hypothetical protein
MTYESPQATEEFSADALSGWSAEPALEPTDRQEDVRASAHSFSDIRDHKGFERRLNLPGVVNSNSKVFVSACELGVFGGQVKPFQGGASIEVHNVVPHDDGVVIVRGFIHAERDINMRLNVFVA